MKTTNVLSITQLFDNTTMQSIIMRTPRLPLGTRYQVVFRMNLSTDIFNYPLLLFLLLEYLFNKFVKI